MLHLVSVIPSRIRYSVYMARGWESKSVEEQLEQREEQREQAAKVASKDVVRAAGAEQARARQMLHLKRERILSEKTSHPVRRSALQAALKDIDAELQKLG
jgi:wyosine [tRNA(Phe)-imidazoG37] synthetase (radical SAM superfamily)